MESTKSTEAEKWKAKYYGLLDKFDKQETDWVKSEQLLSSALSRVSLVAEGQYPKIDSHLQGLRVVLKEKFNLYRVEAVLTELLKLITEFEKNTKHKKTKKIELDLIIDMLAGIKLPKPFQKNKTALLKALKKDPGSIASVSLSLQGLFQELIEAKQETVNEGLFARLFSARKNSESSETLKLLSTAMKQVPWSDAVKDKSKALIQALEVCDDNKKLDSILIKFSELAKKNELSEGVQQKSTDVPLSNEKGDEINADIIKHKSLTELINNLKQSQPQHEDLQSIELSDERLDDEPVLLAEAISSLISLSSGHQQPSTLRYENNDVPKMREVFIQLLEQLVVPVSLMKRVEELKNFLELGDEKHWQQSLKKIAQFINEVRYQQYHEDGGYEGFLQEITNRLQEMVQFLVDENNEIESNNTKGAELNTAVKNQVDELRLGVESSASLGELQSIVNSRIDSISDFMFQHSQLEKSRYDSAKANLEKMQSRITQLEHETVELKVDLEQKNKEAMYDALTEIPNRLFYEKRVKEDVARWKRFETPLSVAIWDVDKFKHVNDTYGHKAGDKVLRAIAQILNKRIRETDFLARYGGEEFVMLLPGTVEEETLRLANELRQAVSNCAFHYNEEDVVITISCGISGFRAEDNIGKVFERADKALYQAKESGRNRCVIAGCLST